MFKKSKFENDGDFFVVFGEKLFGGVGLCCF